MATLRDMRFWGLRAETIFFIFIAVFIAASDIGYYVASKDVTGTVLMGFLTVLGLLCSFYLGVTGRRVGPRPSDRGDADVTEGAGVLGHFSPGSPFPVGMAFGVALGVIGFIFGLWLAIIGVLFFLVMLTGLLFEHVVGKRSVAEDLMR